MLFTVAALGLGSFIVGQGVLSAIRSRLLERHPLNVSESRFDRALNLSAVAPQVVGDHDRRWFEQHILGVTALITRKSAASYRVQVIVEHLAVGGTPGIRDPKQRKTVVVQDYAISYDDLPSELRKAVLTHGEERFTIDLMPLLAASFAPADKPEAAPEVPRQVKLR